MLAFLIAAAGPPPADARPDRDAPALCEIAAANAAAAYGVPADILRALALVETGRRHGPDFRPWPWAVNVSGSGRWHVSATAAHRQVADALAQGSDNADIGCFQISSRWHGRQFASIAEMLEPEANARYAARYLRLLYDELGDWSLAAGAYHSRTPDKALAYRRRFEAMRARLRGAPPGGPVTPGRAATPEKRENTYPLIRVSQTPGRLGSLVPLPARRLAAFNQSGN